MCTRNGAPGLLVMILYQNVKQMTSSSEKEIALVTFVLAPFKPQNWVRLQIYFYFYYNVVITVRIGFRVQNDLLVRLANK